MNNLKYYETGNTTLFKFGFGHPIHKYTDHEVNKMSKQEKEIKKPQESNDGFVKVEDVIFKFENEGDMVEGELIAVEDGKTYNNKVYKIKTEKETLTVFSTSVMESQISQVKIGDLVRIVLTGVKEATVKGRNDTKMFEVFVKAKQ